MSLVTMFLALPPTALAPSWTPFHENSLNDLSSSWPMSVTMPTLRPPPPPGSPAPPQPATTSPKARPKASRRFMRSVTSLSAQPRGRGRSPRRPSASEDSRVAAPPPRRPPGRLRQNAPEDVGDEHDVEAAAEHE